MKKLRYFLTAVVAVAFMALGQSCDDDVTFKTATWQQTTFLRLTSVGENFIKEVNLATLEESWANDTLEIAGELFYEGAANPVSKIDFYIYCQEELDNGVNYIGDGKLIKSVDITAFVDGDFTFKISVDEVYDLFKDEFEVVRDNKLLVSDIFEIKWVIYNEDGQASDKRVGNFTFDDVYSFGVDKIADIWSGTFTYTYVELGGTPADNGLVVGSTGSITFTKTGNGEYSVDDVFFGGNWWIRSGTLNYDYASGEVYFTNTSWEEVTWEFSNFDEQSVDIYWSNQYAAYGDWGKITLTRTDGVDWPTNLTGK